MAVHSGRAASWPAARPVRPPHPAPSARTRLRPSPAGVLQVEALAQLGGIIMIDPSEAAQQNNFFFGGVDNLRWRKPVVPGDVLVRCSTAGKVGEAGR